MATSEPAPPAVLRSVTRIAYDRLRFGEEPPAVQGALMAGGVGAEEARRAVNAGLARIYATRRSRARRVLAGGICGGIFAVGMVVVSFLGWVPITVPLRAVYVGAVGAAVLELRRGWRMRPEAPALLGEPSDAWWAESDPLAR